MQASAVLSPSPSLSIYSTGKLAEITAWVVDELRLDSDLFCFDAMNFGQASTEQSQSQSQGEEVGGEESESTRFDNEDNEDVEEEEEEEFPFVCGGLGSSPISTDENFCNGHISPVYLFSNRDLLLNGVWRREKDKDDPKKTDEAPADTEAGATEAGDGCLQVATAKRYIRWVACVCCIQFDESTVAFKERLGKFDEVLQPGCHFLPRTLGFKLAGNLSHRLQQLDVKCETKTKIYKMGNRCCCIQVDESTVAFKERLGKFDEVLQPGCHFLPSTLGYKLAGNLSLRLQQLDVKCETKTKDNVFVTVIASVQYRVLANKAKDAFYNLSNPIGQIQAHVIDAIGASVAKLDLGEAFEKKNEISKAVENALVQVMLAYGYEILKTLIIDIILDERAKQAISEFNAAKKKAEAEASHVDALRNSVLGFYESCPGTTVKDIMDMVVTTRYLDTIKEIGAKSKSSVILIPHGTGGIRDVGTQIRDGLLKASTSQ